MDPDENRPSTFKSFRLFKSAFEGVLFFFFTKIQYPTLFILDTNLSSLYSEYTLIRLMTPHVRYVHNETHGGDQLGKLIKPLVLNDRHGFLETYTTSKFVHTGEPI